MSRAIFRCVMAVAAFAAWNACYDFNADFARCVDAGLCSDSKGPDGGAVADSGAGSDSGTGSGVDGSQSTDAGPDGGTANGDAGGRGDGGLDPCAWDGGHWGLGPLFNERYVALFGDAQDLWLAGFDGDSGIVRVVPSIVYSDLQSGPLQQTWGVSASDFWTAGLDTNSYGRLVHWSSGTPTGWNVPFDTTGGSQSHMDGLWGMSTAIYTIESGGSLNRLWKVPIDGGPPTVLDGDAGTLRGVWASAAGTAWAAGHATSFDGLVVRYPADGGVTVFNGVCDAGSQAMLNAIWGTSDQDVWAAGDRGCISHWNGGSWKQLSNGPSAQSFLGISGTGPSDVWFVGNNGAAAHWDGVTVSIAHQVSVSFGDVLGSVWARSPCEVWAPDVVGTFQNPQTYVLTGP